MIKIKYIFTCFLFIITLYNLSAQDEKDYYVLFDAKQKGVYKKDGNKDTIVFSIKGQKFFFDKRFMKKRTIQSSYFKAISFLNKKGLNLLRKRALKKQEIKIAKMRDDSSKRIKILKKIFLADATNKGDIVLYEVNWLVDEFIKIKPHIIECVFKSKEHTRKLLQKNIKIYSFIQSKRLRVISTWADDCIAFQS